MGRSLPLIGCQMYKGRKGPQKKPFRVLEISIAPSEQQDDDIVMEEAPLHTTTISSYDNTSNNTPDSDVRRWSIVEEELVRMMQALHIIRHPDDLPEPQFVHLERLPPRYRVPCTPAQAQEIENIHFQINCARDTWKEKERRRRGKDLGVIKLIEDNFRLLQTGDASPETVEHVKHAERVKSPRHVKHVGYVTPAERVSHIEHDALAFNPLRAPEMFISPAIVNTDAGSANPLRIPEMAASPTARRPAKSESGSMNPVLQPEIVASASAKAGKRHDQTSNITPKVIPLDAKCPTRDIYPDHLAAANIAPRMRSRPETPLLKKVMLRNLQRTMSNCVRRINESRRRAALAY
ncbi:hypothetical protein M432DRAFT_587953 [Thermoascus aurantiacus ATCC 26904]